MAGKLGKPSKKLKPRVKRQEAEVKSAVKSEEKSKKTKIRKAEIVFSVSPDFRKKYKRVAKEAGYKKSQFLSILLAHWLEKSPISPENGI